MQEGVYVDSHRAVRQSSENLRRRVLRGAVALGHFPVEDAAGEVEAVKLDVRVVPRRPQEEVLGLQVTMDDAQVVAVLHGGDQHAAQIPYVFLAVVRLQEQRWDREFVRAACGTALDGWRTAVEARRGGYLCHAWP